MAPSGKNGDKDTSIGLSSSMSLSFSDKNGDEINIYNSSEKIDVWIPRDLTVPKPELKYMNISGSLINSTFLPVYFNITTNNASVHFELYPDDTSVEYLVLFKTGSLPILNETMQDYDEWRIFCTQGILYKNFLFNKNLKFLYENCRSSCK